jgi:cytochrome P450 RapN/nocardicin N-oxygenase
MAVETQEILSYPLGLHHDLTMGEEYRQLQQQGPVKVQLPYGEPAWLATRYDDCRTVYTDKRFGKAYGVGRETPRMIPNRIADDPDNLAYMDTARHTRVRRLALAAFSTPQAERSRSWIQAIVDDALDAFAAGGNPSDWEEHVAWPVPLRVICRILGVADEDIATYRGWIDQLLSPQSPPEVKTEMQGNLLGYIRARIAERRESPTDDALSMLVSARDDNDALSEEELVKLSMNLFLAGFETTASMIGSSMWTLMANHEVWEELVADRSLVPAALEELWRFVPTFRHGWPPVRWALEDIELSGGVVIPAGEPVIPEVMIANRDESVFPHGWELDIHRENPMPHLSLAYGSHRCLGAAVAMMEIDLTLRTTLDRFPDLHLSVPADQVDWSTTSFMRSPAVLPLTW